VQDLLDSAFSVKLSTCNKKDMKTLKLIPWVYCVFAALSLTACLKDVPADNSLTPQEIQTAFKSVEGHYTGHVIYNEADLGSGLEAKLDTASVTWDLNTDSTLIIHEFPTRFLAKHISDPSIREALEAQPNQDMICYIGFIGINPVTFLVNPYTDAFYLFSGVETRKLQIGFLMNNYFSYGAWSAEKKLLQMQIVQGGIFIDDVLQSGLLPTSVSFMIEGSRE